MLKFSKGTWRRCASWSAKRSRTPEQPIRSRYSPTSAIIEGYFFDFLLLFFLPVFFEGAFFAALFFAALFFAAFFLPAFFAAGAASTSAACAPLPPEVPC